MRKSNHLVFAAFLLSALAVSFSTPTYSQETPKKKILIFSSEEVRLPAMTITEDAIRSTFSQYPSNQIAFYNEAQDNARIGNEKYENEYVQFLRRKYEGENIDLIFVRSPPGVRFLLKHEAELFPGVPKIFVTNDQRELDGLNLGNNFTGVFGKIEFGPTLDLILKQRPTTRKVVVVTGSAVQDHAYLDQAKKDFSAYSGRVEIVYLSDFTIQALEKELSSLPSDNACLFIAYGRDPAGNGYSQPEAISMLAPTSKVPIYALTDTALGSGTVGGDMLSVKLMGERAGEMGLRILSGQKPSDIPPQTVESVPMFDWRQLRRWDISEEALPVGSVVRYKEPTAWEQYKGQIIGLVIFSIFQTLLIGWLLLLRERKKKAEIESLRFAALAEAEHQKLDSVVANVPGIVWESRVEKGSDDRRIVFVSDYVEQMLGYTPAEISAIPNFWKSIVPEEDQEGLFHATKEILLGRQTGVQEFRCVTRDGVTIWVEAHLAPSRDEAGNVVGIRGVAIDVTDRIRAEEAMQESETRFRDTADSASVLIWIANPEMLITYCNKALLEFTGKSAVEMAGEGWLESVHEDDRLQCVDAYTKGYDAKEPFALDYRLRRADGEYRWILDNCVPRFASNREFLGYVGSAVDYTDVKMASVAVQESEARFRNMADSAPVLIWMSDIDPLITFVNKFGTDYTGLTSEQLRGEAWLNAIHEDDRQRCVDIYTAAYERREPFVYEYRIRGGGGEFQWFYCTSAPRFALNGEFLGYVGTCVNINDRKKAEEALSESEERYRNVVETQTELICRYLPDTTLTFVNDAYCRYFGKTREELIGTKFVNLIPIHARDAALSHVASLVENPRAETYEHEVLRPDGTRGWHQWVDRGVETSNGHPPELQGIGRDVTEKRQAEELLRVSENRFRIMADSAPVLIWMCGPDKLCTYVNQGWLDFTGRSIEMELGNGWTEGIHPKDRDRTSEVFNSAFDRKESFKLEYRLRGADAEYYWVYDSGTPRLSSDGEFLGFIGSCVDISDRKQAEDGMQRALDEVRMLQKQLHEENIYLREVIELEHDFDEFIGHSDALKYVLFKIEQVAKTTATVLITGETGTGKELVARAIHSTSPRRGRPLVKVNCAALSATLIESELFGHERGAFTGASARKIGRFELADGATIFLDEVGELPLELQVKLLRVVQEGEFERLGSSKTIKVDARIIAATNRNLESEVQKGNFREDLLFRLNVFPITVPPLRERKDDIPELVEYFANRFSKKVGKTISSVSPATIRTLENHSWPGNIRELANVIERSVINSPSENLRVIEEFDSANADLAMPEPIDTLEAVERKYITQVLGNAGWKIEGANGAARILGLNPSTLRTRMAKLGISKPQSRSADAG